MADVGAGLMGMVKQAFGAAKAAVTGDDAGISREIIDGEKYYKSGLEEQKPFHPVWFRNIAMLTGQHWLDWNNQTNWFQETASPSWRVRLTANFILPIIRTMIGRELQNNPTFYGIPANDDPTSFAAAKLASKLFEAKYMEEDFLNMMIRLRYWAKGTGSSYLFALWDSTRGKRWTDAKRDPLTGAPVMDPETGQPVTQEYAEGDVIFDVANSFEVIKEPAGPDNFDEHTRIMRVKLMDVGAIKSKWGIEVEPEKATIDIMYQTRIMAIVDASGRFRTDTAEGSVIKNKALVKDYYEEPSAEFPDGRHFTYSNGKILQATEPLDYFRGGRRKIPCSQTIDSFVPGRSDGQSIIEHIGPLNVQYNKMTSQTIENCNLMNRPKVLSPMGSLEDDVFTDQPAEIVEYVPGPQGQKPEAFKQAEMPEYFFQQKDKLPDLMQLIAGVPDVSLGRLPRRANSGVAIEALQDADDTPISLSVRSWATCLSKVMSTALEQMQRKYTEQKIVAIVGRQHIVETVAFKGADLKGCNSVRVTFGPHLTKQQKSDLAFKLLENNVISREQALSIVDLGYLDEIFDAPPPPPNPTAPPVQAPVTNLPPPMMGPPGLPPGALPPPGMPPGGPGPALPPPPSRPTGPLPGPGVRQ